MRLWTSLLIHLVRNSELEMFCPAKNRCRLLIRKINLIIGHVGTISYKRQGLQLQTLCKCCITCDYNYATPLEIGTKGAAKKNNQPSLMLVLPVDVDCCRLVCL